MSRARVFLVLLFLLTWSRVSFAGKAEEPYVSSLSQPALMTAQTTNVQQELELQVTEIVNLGHMAPTLYYTGLGADPVIFYVTPSETIYTLSAAYPYLSASLQTQVKSFLDAEIQNYPLHSQGYYAPNAGKVSDFVGAHREYFVPNPDEGFNFWPGIPVHISTLYSVWLYSYNTDDWTYATSNYIALKSIYTDFKSVNSIASYPELAGVIGFSRIAQHLGHTSDYQDATNFANTGFANGADFNQFLSTARTRYPSGNHSYSTPIFMFNRNPAALHFNQDIGQFLQENAAAAVSVYADEINQDIPLWWLTGTALSGENAYTTPEISWTNFMLHAYVLNTPIEQLKSYLDAPDRKGDLLYIQKLVAVLEALDTPNLYSSTKTASNNLLHTGQRVTYTIAIRNSGASLATTVHLTDIVPAGLTYVPGSLTASLGTPDESSAPTLRWSGDPGGESLVTVTYAADVAVPADVTQVVSNTATLDAGSGNLVTCVETIIANALSNYLPIIVKEGP